METIQLETLPMTTTTEEQSSAIDDNKSFLNANTTAITMEDLKQKCIIPSFAKDNESTISHTHFLEAVLMTAQNVFSSESFLPASVRVSHPVRGRIPSAMGKPAKLLAEEEKTLYYERMMFAIEIPSIRDSVSGNELSLTLGGVRAYNQENLYSRKSEEKFKLFIGFKNKVCTNLCISTDGFVGELRVRTVSEIVEEAFKLFGNFNPNEDVRIYEEMTNNAITERQFATLVGRSRMYQFLPQKMKKDLPVMPLMDSQISTITKDYYNDESFARNEDGNIDLWRLYNLFTGANKSSYVDSFLHRNVESRNFVCDLQEAVREESGHWFIS